MTDPLNTTFDNNILNKEAKRVLSFLHHWNCFCHNKTEIKKYVVQIIQSLSIVE